MLHSLEFSQGLDVIDKQQNRLKLLLMFCTDMAEHSLYSGAAIAVQFARV